MKSIHKMVVRMYYGANSGKHKSGACTRRTAKKIARRLDAKIAEGRA
jgi:hypothetical protein